MTDQTTLYISGIHVQHTMNWGGEINTKVQLDKETSQWITHISLYRVMLSHHLKTKAAQKLKTEHGCITSDSSVLSKLMSDRFEPDSSIVDSLLKNHEQTKINNFTRLLLLPVSSSVSESRTLLLQRRNIKHMQNCMCSMHVQHCYTGMDQTHDIYTPQFIRHSHQAPIKRLGPTGFSARKGKQLTSPEINGPE